MNNNNNLEKLKQVVEDLHLDNAYGTVQVAYGCKHSKGKYTEEKCIRFGVEKKLPLNQIPQEKRIPSKINVDGVEYSTDVYVVPTKIYTSATMRKLGENNAANGGPLSLSVCNPVGDDSVPPNVTAPVSVNRATTRPLRGGVSMAATPPTGYVNAGTLGVMVLDSTDNKLVALTNNHVCATPGGSNPSTSKFFSDDYNFPATYAAYNNINMYQQSSWDSGVVNKSTDLIGITKRAYPLRSTGSNYVDCGIVNLSNAIVDSGSWDVIGATFGGTPPPFASTAEIDAITTSTEVFKSGRTTGPIGPDTYSSCVVQITNTSTSLYVSGYTDAGNDAVLFSDCLAIESDGTVVGLGGDSGSGVYAKIGGIWKLVGLFFAGAEEGSPGFACRIDRVANLLKISAYTGGTVNAATGSRSYITANSMAYGSQATISFNGKTYWQVGKNP
jgi:hypothetical protein